MVIPEDFLYASAMEQTDVGRMLTDSGIDMAMLRAALHLKDDSG